MDHKSKTAMEITEMQNSEPKIPDAIMPPIHVDVSAEVVPIWSGIAKLTQGSNTQTGDAKVFVDTLPRPIIRFEFKEQAESNDTTGMSQLRRFLEGTGLPEGLLDCGTPLGTFTVNPTYSAGGIISGSVDGSATEPSDSF